MARWKNINGVLQKIAGSVRIDQVLNKLSRNAISNKAVSEKFEEVDLSLEIAANDIDALSDNVSGLSDNVSTLSNNLASLSGIVTNTNKTFQPKQVGDTNVFENTFGVFYDWTGYWKQKTGINIPSYTVGIRIPTADTAYIKFVAIDTSGAIHMMNINGSNRTIAFSRTIS